MYANGRWNLHGLGRLIYLSREPETSFSESNAHTRYYNLTFDMPKVIVAVYVRLELVLDLTISNNRRQMPQTITKMLAEDWRKMNQAGEESMSQSAARAAFDVGYHGLLLPSQASARGINLLVFVQNLTADCDIRVLNPEKLTQVGK